VNCAEFGATIHEFIDGLLPKADADAARAHVASCADCAERVETAKRFARLLVDEGDAAIDAWTAHATVGRALSTDPTREGALRRAAPFVATAAASIAASVLVALALFSPSAAPPAPENLAEGASVELPRGRHVLAAAGREIESEDSAVIGVVAGSGGGRTPGLGTSQAGGFQTLPPGFSVRFKSWQVARPALTPPEMNSASITLMRLPSRTILVVTSTGDRSGRRYMSTVSRAGKKSGVRCSRSISAPSRPAMTRPCSELGFQGPRAADVGT